VHQNGSVDVVEDEVVEDVVEELVVDVDVEVVVDVDDVTRVQSYVQPN